MTENASFLLFFAKSEYQENIARAEPRQIL